MHAPVFETAVASVGVTTLLGSTPTRLYLFGQAPQPVTLPYAVWQQVSGSPYNHLTSIPRVDRYTTQIDVYGASVDSVRGAAEALRDAFEPVAKIENWRGESRDATTQNYRYGFDVVWNVLRESVT